MGIEQHQFILAVTFRSEEFDKMWKWTQSMDLIEVDSEIYDPKTLFAKIPCWANWVSSIVMGSDGSKNGWQANRVAQEVREAFTRRLRESEDWSWRVVGWGDLGDLMSDPENSVLGVATTQQSTDENREYELLASTYRPSKIKTESELVLAESVLKRLNEKITRSDAENRYYNIILFYTYEFHRKRVVIRSSPAADVLQHLLDSTATTVAELCDATAVPPGVVRCVLSSANVLRKEQLQPIADHFGVAVELLINREFEENPKTPWSE